MVENLILFVGATDSAEMTQLALSAMKSGMPILVGALPQYIVPRIGYYTPETVTIWGCSLRACVPELAELCVQDFGLPTTVDLAHCRTNTLDRSDAPTQAVLSTRYSTLLYYLEEGCVASPLLTIVPPVNTQF
jgi:hypothetical protein